MKQFLVSFLLLLLFVAHPGFSQTQDKKEPESKLIEFHMALLKRGPSYSAEGMSKDLQSEHVANVVSLLESGKAVIAGPLGDDSDIAGIFILRAKSAEEARAWAEKDPAVKAGFFIVEMHPWWSGRHEKPNSRQVDHGLSGSAQARREVDAGKTPATAELQKAHGQHHAFGEMKSWLSPGPW